MADLSTKMRNALPKSAFAGPGRSFPVQDKAHARAALQDIPKLVKAGNLSPSTAAAIKAKARAKLGKPAPKMSSYAKAKRNIGK